MKEIENILNETLQQVLEFRGDYLNNEQAVRTQLIEPVLNALGWKTSNPKFVRPNAPNEEGKIPDYILLKDTKNKLVVEAKNLSVELADDKVINQIANYCYKPGIDFGILTNGVKWLLFKTFEKNPQDRIVWQVDLEKDKLDFVARNLSSFAYENIDTLDSLLKTSKTLEKNWTELNLSPDNIVEIISQKLLENIKKTDKAFKIDENDLKTFTQSKLDMLMGLPIFEDESDESNEEIINDEQEPEFSEVKDVIFKGRQIREKISVTFPDKTVFKNRKVITTFVDTIKKIGPEKVLPLEIYRAGVPIVSKEKDKFYSQKKLGIYWIMACTSTKEKITVLNEINERLNLKLKIESFTMDR